MKHSPELQTTVATHHEVIEKPLQANEDDQDIGATIADLGVAQALTPADNRRVLRRIDAVLMPLMFISYGLQYVDKAILGASSQFGIIQDLGLYDIVIVNGKPKTDLSKFSYATLMFYWGFVVGAFPAAYLAQRFPIGRFCGVSIAIWGAITMATAGVTSYPGIMVLRFFLGFVEAAIPAAFSLIVAMWYKKDEQPLRFAIWVSASGLGGVLGTIILWGIGHIKDDLHPWQYQFLILGAVTVLWGFVIMFVLPNNPVEGKFLSTSDKVIAVERMRAGQTGIENSKFKVCQLKEALLDVKTWAYVLITFCVQLVNGAVSGFGSIIISSFGFGRFESVLITGALGGVVFVTLLLAGLVTFYSSNQRCNLAFIACLPIIAGSTIVWKTSWASVGAPLAGFMLVGFFTVPYIMVLALVAANTGGHTKKAVTTAMVWGAYCVSNGVSPLLVRTTEVMEHYPTLFIPLIGLLSVCVLVIIALRWHLQRCNKKRDSAAIVDRQAADRMAFADLTDKENPNFRYSW